MKSLIILFIVLMILKVAGYLNVAWWIVMMPLWIFPAFIVGIVALASIFCLLMVGGALIVLSVLSIWSLIDDWRYK